MSHSLERSDLWSFVCTEERNDVTMLLVLQNRSGNHLKYLRHYEGVVPNLNDIVVVAAEEGGATMKMVVVGRAIDMEGGSPGFDPGVVYDQYVYVVLAPVQSQQTKRVLVREDYANRKGTP